MNKNRVWRNLLLIIVFSVFLGFTANPYKFEPLEPISTPVVGPVWNGTVVSLWNWMQESTVRLGLDLQGGTQLDYEIDLRDARERNSDDNPDNDVDIAQLLSGVKDVIERRVDNLGVAEPNIYLSSAGEEQHIVVELPGVEDLDDAKDRVGKVVQLEFKTEKEEPSESDVEAISEKAQEFFDRLLAEEEIEDLEAYIEDDAVVNQLEYRKEEDVYLDELPAEFQQLVGQFEVGSFYPELVQARESSSIYVEGRFVQPEGLNIVRLISSEKELRKAPNNAEPFEDVLEERGGTKEVSYVSEEEIPEDLQLEVIVLEDGEVSDVIETDTGFHIVKVGSKLPIDTSDQPITLVDTSHILFKTQNLPSEVVAEVPLIEVPEGASEEERQEIEEENQQIEQQNAEARERRLELEAQTAEVETANEEQRNKALDVLQQIQNDPTTFEDLAREFSEDSSAENGGALGYSNVDNYVDAYKEAVLALEKGQMTQELVKSQFGYHIIKVHDIKLPEEERFRYDVLSVCYEGATGCEESTTSKEDALAEAEELLRRVREESAYSLERIWFNASPDPWEKTELDGRYFKRAEVVYDQISYRPYVSVTFDDEGAQLFEQITEQNVGKPLGIFVGGEFISAPNVNERISGGQAQITMGTPNVQIALQEANELAQSLNAGSIPAPLKKPDELNIGASLGQDALQKSLKAGALGLILVALFMVFWYRLLGVLSALSLLIYGLFLIFAIESEVSPVLAVILTFVMWISFFYSLLRSKVDGIAQALFLTLSILGVLFIFYVLTSPIVLTLAGVAGIILSIGMAVDANILIFERIKEEFAQGKSFLTAVNDGFGRAWSSILDSNVSSLITCAILFMFGTSIIKGFAFNLAAGILISMFTAITVTKTFLLIFEGTNIERMKWLWKRKS